MTSKETVIRAVLFGLLAVGAGALAVIYHEKAGLMVGLGLVALAAGVASMTHWAEGTRGNII